MRNFSIFVTVPHIKIRGLARILFIAALIFLWHQEHLIASDAIFPPMKKNIFNIKKQSLEKSLLTFSEITGIQVISRDLPFDNLESHAVKGLLKPSDALRIILSKSQLRFYFVGNYTVVINNEKVKALAPASAADNKDDFSKSDNFFIEPAHQRILDEIIVSAQKRDQNLRDVPIHVDVLQDTDIKNSHFTRMEDLVALLPTVTFTQRRGYDQSTFRIRGVGTQALGAGVEPSVVTVIDGVVMARGGSMINELPDIERIEILNGPQGTLFGKNTSAGVLNIITKSPNHTQHEITLHTRLTSDREYKGRVSLTGPISDNTAFLLNARFGYWDGNVKNVTTNNYVNGLTMFGFRGKLHWLASDRTDFMLSGDYSRQNTECCARIIRQDRLKIFVNPAKAGSPIQAGSIADVAGIPLTEFSDQIAQNRDPLSISTNYGFSLESNIFVGNLKLTSISAFRGWKSRNGWDNDLLPIPFNRKQKSDRDVKWLTQEIRLASPGGQKIDYLLGLYYYWSRTDALEFADRIFVDQDIDQLIFVQSRIIHKNIALFGNADVKLSDRATLFGGLRLLNDHVGASAQRGGADHDLLGNIIADNSTGLVRNNGSETALIGKTGLRYILSEQLNSYFSYGTGYKGKAFSLEFGFNPEHFLQNEPVRAERTRTYEMGIRGLYFSRRLRLHIAAYHTRIDGLQLGLRDLTTIANTLGSVPTTNVKGVEINITAQPVNSLSLDVGIAYNDARFSRFKDGLCYLGQTETSGCINGVQDLSQHVLENAPKWKIVARARYEWPILHDAYLAYIQPAYRFQSAVFLSDDADPASRQTSFSIIDFSVGITGRDERIRLDFFVKNLLNQKYVAGVSANSADGGGVIVHTIPRDFKRFFGLSLKWKIS